MLILKKVGTDENMPLLSVKSVSSLLPEVLSHSENCFRARCCRRKAGTEEAKPLPTVDALIP